jgi:hypothetical protein
LHPGNAEVFFDSSQKLAGIFTPVLPRRHSPENWTPAVGVSPKIRQCMAVLIDDNGVVTPATRCPVKSTVKTSFYARRTFMPQQEAFSPRDNHLAVCLSSCKVD